MNLSQPLLKNFGPTPTLARIRIAAMASQIAFQQYRRQTLLVLASAEAAYWDLFLAQEQVRLGTKSVAIAERILADKQERVAVGKSPQIEVLSADRGVELVVDGLVPNTRYELETSPRLDGSTERERTPILATNAVQRLWFLSSQPVRFFQLRRVP